MLGTLHTLAATQPAQNEALQQLMRPPWSTVIIVTVALFGLWNLYLFLPSLMRLGRLLLNALGRRADQRTLRWISLSALAAALITSGVRVTFSRSDPELQYYILTGVQLFVVVALVLLVVAFITWITMGFFQVAGRWLMSRRYVLFVGWNFLKSHRKTVATVNAYDGGHKPASWACVLAAALLGGTAYGAEYLPWARYIGDLEPAVPVFRWTLAGLAGVLLTWPLRPLRSPGSIDFFDRLEVRVKNLPNLLTVTVTTFISIVGVGVGVWALVVVLSVMAGFETDLRSKILATNPHVVIQDDAPMEGIPDVDTLLDRLKAIDGVTDAIPYVQGDVIITSRENRNVSLTLRGIDPGDVSASEHHLRGSIVTGVLDNLQHPERLVPSARWLLRQTPDGADIELSPGPRQPSPPSGGDSIEPPLVPEDDGRESEDSEDEIEPTALTVQEEDLQPTAIDTDPDDIEPSLIPGVDDPSAPALDEGIRPGILLGQELATSLRVDVGSEVTVVSPRDDAGFLGIQPRARTFRVAGIFHTGMYDFDLKLAYIAISEAQRFFHMGADINRIELRLDDVDRSDEVVAAIAPLIEGTRSLSAVDWKQLNRNLFSALQLEKIVMFIVLSFIILVASFNVVGSLAMIILEKSKEIAILKSMGASRREIRTIFIVLGSVIGTIGSVAGLSVGLLTCWFIRYVGIQLPRQYYIDMLPVHVDPVTVSVVFLSGIVLCLLATIYPAMEAGRIEPVEGLRFD